MRRIERSYLVRVVQVYEGDVPDNWDGMEWHEQDEYIIANWTLVSDDTELLDDDQLDLRDVEPPLLLPSGRYIGL